MLPLGRAPAHSEWWPPVWHVYSNAFREPQPIIKESSGSEPWGQVSAKCPSYQTAKQQIRPLSTAWTTLQVPAITLLTLISKPHTLYFCDVLQGSPSQQWAWVLIWMWAWLLSSPLNLPAWWNLWRHPVCTPANHPNRPRHPVNLTQALTTPRTTPQVKLNSYRTSLQTCAGKTD